MDFWTGVANPDGTIISIYNADDTHLNNEGHEVLFQRAVASVHLPFPVTVSPTNLLSATDGRELVRHLR